MKVDSPLLIDSHCHLTEPVFAKNVRDYLQRAEESGVQAVISVGIDTGTSAAAVEQAEKFHGVYATAGLHPHEADRYDEKTLGIISDLTEHEKVVAIGETGLDYHYEFSPRKTQKSVFATQVVLAREKHLPLVVHSREAVRDAIGIIREYGKGRVYGVFHCFTGTEEEALEIMDLGFYISFAGNMTYKGFDAGYLPRIPLDRLLVETDAPYLAPIPHRGKTNESSYLPLVLQGFTRFIKSESAARIGRFTTHNAVVLFGLEAGSQGKIVDLLEKGVD
jgi:TatD DNase family protein